MSEGDPTPPETSESPGESEPVAPTAGQWAEACAQIAALRAQLKDQQLRALAELDNVRKRAERDGTQTAKFGAEKLMRDLLAIADSLELGRRAGADATAQSVLDGVELTHRQLMSVLQKHGVTVVDPAVGELFDPHLHEAVTVIASTAVPPNCIVELMQTGYLLHDRLLRPARVVVSRAAPLAGA
ncbi:MAG TPA: nucleotide exchange factor GrpE [Nevskiaceae bacterium]